MMGEQQQLQQPSTASSKKHQKKKKKVIEYNRFIEEFEFVHLSGLKGLEKAKQIQQKSSNRMFDYVEMDLRGVKQIDEYEEYCEQVLNILFSIELTVVMPSSLAAAGNRLEGDPLDEVLLASVCGGEPW